MVVAESPNIDDQTFKLLFELQNLSNVQTSFIHAFIECSDKVRDVAEEMLAILADADSSEEKKLHAKQVFASALFPNQHKGEFGMDLVASESEAAENEPELAAHVNHMDRQETIFADRVRKLMRQKHVSQAELGKRIGCSQSAVSHMLNRECRPQKKTIVSISNALGVEPTELWPDMQVVEILDEIADFQEDHELTPTEAAALQSVADRSSSTITGRALPSRKAKR